MRKHFWKSAAVLCSGDGTTPSIHDPVDPSTHPLNSKMAQLHRSMILSTLRPILKISHNPVLRKARFLAQRTSKSLR